MREILTKKKISKNDADRIVAQALDAAADHRLEYMRRDRLIHDLERSKKDRQRLISHLSGLALSISKLPPVSKGKLNKIIAQQNWQHFDAEMFSELMRAMQDALSTLSPARFANIAGLAISEPLRASKDPVVARIVRTAPPAIAELWEIIPAATRSQVEADIRRWTPPQRGQVTMFLNHLVDLLKTHRPTLKGGRRLVIGRYLQNVAKIWRGFELNVGRAFDGRTSTESPFQRFARFALLAVDDSSRISVRQIVNLKRKSRRRRNGR
jgi:hypothetical protein